MTIHRLAFTFLTIALLAGPHLLAGKGAEQDLTKIKEGEKKVMQKGEMKVTAERDGDTVHLTIKNPDGKTKKMDIDVDDANVAVVKVDGEGGKHHVIVKKIVTDDGEARFVIDDDEDEAISIGPSNIHFDTVETDDGKTRLRCPKGDTTMRVDEKDAKATFLCPKHKIKLEPVKERRKQVFVQD